MAFRNGSFWNLIPPLWSPDVLPCGGSPQNLAGSEAWACNFQEPCPQHLIVWTLVLGFPGLPFYSFFPFNVT